MGSGATTSASRTCEVVQLALIRGELPEELRAHADACSECGFLRTLSRNLQGAMDPDVHAGPLGGAMHAALAAALGGGELLLGRYQLKELIGRGGYGEVYRTLDTETDELVALKIVRVRAGDDRSTEEVRNARRVVHPNVCRVFHTERYGELRLIVMELVDGVSLDRAPVARTRGEALGRFRGIAAGVHAAHEAGVLHLDLKPRNVLLRDGRTPVVTDFGLSVRVVGGEAVRTASGGTPAYMAPEQRDGRAVDRRTDVYALGLMLRELLRGRPRLLGRVVRRATAAEPERRHRDVAALLRAVDIRGRLGRWALRIGMALLAVVAVLAVLVLVLPPPTGPRAGWREELWGPDPVPASAWNVARNRGGGRPRVVSPAGRGFACGDNLGDLIDGLNSYSVWERGFSFPAQVDVCIGLDYLEPHGRCGVERPDARLCEIYEAQIEAERPFRPLERRVAERAAVAPSPGARLGQLEEKVPCGERILVVELDRPRPVIAVRAWHFHMNNVPRTYAIRVRDAAGEMHEPFRSNDVRPAVMWKPLPGFYPGQPQTAQFPAVTAREVHYVMDTCTMKAGGQGWLFELEVFAEVSRLEAWRRYLFD